jgi:hypothetical protein
LIYWRYDVITLFIASSSNALPTPPFTTKIIDTCCSVCAGIYACGRARARARVCVPHTPKILTPIAAAAYRWLVF